MDKDHITIKPIDAKIREYEASFIDIIRKRLGIIIHTHQSKNLQKTLANACKKFNVTPEQYLQTLQECDDNSPLLAYLIAEITIGETYFFRDQKQMQLLREVVLPKLIQKKREEHNLSLRIWSAGCASGEEIYTVAMLLKELIADFDKWTIKLLATDINAKVLKKGISGRYSDWSMRSIPDYFKKQYFTNEKKEYVISEELRDLIFFDFLNLNDNTYPSIFNGTNAQDLILCRNVLIYFDSDGIKRLMPKLNASLNEDGFLLLGASDPVYIDETDFVFHHTQGLLFSKKMDKFPVNKPIPAALGKEFILPAKQILTPPKQKPLPKVVKKHEDIQYEDVIKKLMSESKWQEALSLIDRYFVKEKPSKFLLNAKAAAFANLGKLTEALTLCEENFKIDPTNKLTYFTYALALTELNRLTEAEAALRKTLFLDNQFVVAHFQLGLLLLRNKQQEAGIKSLRNALKIVVTKDPSEPVQGSHGLSYGRFAEILNNEIDLYCVAKEYEEK